MSRRPRVRVDETRIFAADRNESATWWFWYRARAERVGRITIEGSHFLGDTVTVDCQTADEADAWLVDQMRNVGVPQAAMKVLGAR